MYIILRWPENRDYFEWIKKVRNPGSAIIADIETLLPILLEFYGKDPVQKITIMRSLKMCSLQFQRKSQKRKKLVSRKNLKKP